MLEPRPQLADVQTKFIIAIVIKMTVKKQSSLVIVIAIIIMDIVGTGKSWLLSSAFCLQPLKPHLRKLMDEKKGGCHVQFRKAVRSVLYCVITCVTFGCTSHVVFILWERQSINFKLYASIFFLIRMPKHCFI